jgi:hypothetical protein
LNEKVKVYNNKWLTWKNNEVYRSIFEANPVPDSARLNCRKAKERKSECDER